MSRRTRTATTMLVLVITLVAAAYFGWVGLTQGWLGDDGGTASAGDAERACTRPPAVTVRSRSVRVSVYNAGAPAGQATEVMDALTGQGFDQGELTDAPESIEVEGIVLWPGDAEPGVVRLVERQFDEVRVARRTRTLGPGVNVLVGEDFDRLARRAPRAIEYAAPRRCEPAG